MTPRYDGILCIILQKAFDAGMVPVKGTEMTPPGDDNFCLILQKAFDADIMLAEGI